MNILPKWRSAIIRDSQQFSGIQHLNFPDEFAEAVKKAGINLVTTANNHLLDKKLDGAMRTLDILDKYNISHVGSYRNYEEKNIFSMIFIIFN